MWIYEIAQIIISGTKTFDLVPDWKQFKIGGSESQKVDITAVISCAKPSCLYRNIECITPQKCVAHVLRHENDYMLCDNHYIHNQILPVCDPQSIDVFFLQLFYTHAVRRQMIQLHAATIEDQGRGILFLGPSGIGKNHSGGAVGGVPGRFHYQRGRGLCPAQGTGLHCLGHALAWVVSLLPECFGARKGTGGAETGPGKQAAGADWL